MLFNRIMYFLLILAAVMFMIFFDGYLGVFFLILVLALPIVSFGFMFLLRAQVMLDISATKPAYLKSERIIIRLKSRSKRKLLYGKISVRFRTTNSFTADESQDYIYISPTYYPQTVDLVFSSKHCGSLLCSVDEIRVYDFLMLFHIKKKRDIDKLFCRTCILPNIRSSWISAEALGVPDDSGAEYSKCKPGDDPSEIFDIREYREGDRIRRIHYRLSEKHNELIVKDFGEPVSGKALILIDFSNSVVLSEESLGFLCGIAQTLKNSGVSFSVKWLDAEGEQIHEYSEVRPDIGELSELILESAFCRSGLMRSYDFKKDTDKYSFVIYIGSKISGNAAARLCDISSVIPVSVYELCNRRYPPSRELKNLPLKVYVFNI